MPKIYVRASREADKVTKANSLQFVFLFYLRKMLVPILDIKEDGMLCTIANIVQKKKLFSSMLAKSYADFSVYCPFSPLKISCFLEKSAFLTNKIDELYVMKNLFQNF